jgi:hypothetical protein
MRTSVTLLFDLATVHLDPGYEHMSATASAQGPNRSSDEQMRSTSFSADGFIRSHEAAGENEE